MLEQEYDLERNGDSTITSGSYADNLLQTIEKQGAEYIDAKKTSPVKGADAAFKTFIYNFEQDIEEELYRCKVRFNPPLS